MKFTAKLEDLQERLALADSSNDKRNHPENVLVLMVYRTQNIKFRMDKECRHKMPHLHIDYGRHYRTASFSINPAEKLAGSLATKHSKIVIEWVNENQETLLNMWANLQEGKDVSHFVESLRGNS
ncbi:MAG: DUF4160 domain-containing protein [Gammaproteobacteria bacterium]|nr:DUF4160 domain-containing protein [Gammaproteobacteria bacterium]